MRLIDADALEGRILMDVPGFMDGGSEITKAFILAMIKTRSVTPTVDAIPVVRCRDCKHKEESVSPSWEAWCNRLHCGCDLDWFCADGERRLEEKQPEYPCINCCSPSERAACCGCPKERQWQEKYGDKK